MRILLPRWVLACAGFAVAISLPSHGADEAAGALADVEVEEVSVEDLSSDAASLSVQLAARSTRTVTIRSLAFDDVRINGVPVHVPPVETNLALRAGEPVRGLPRLQLRIAFRQLDSLRPIREIVTEEKAHLHLILRAELVLTLFQRLMVMSSGLWVVTPVDRDVEVKAVGGLFGQTAAHAALLAAEPLWILGREAIDYRRRTSEFAVQARQRAESCLVRLQTTYGVTNREGQTALIKHDGLGFLSGSGEVITTAEAIEPWTFEAGMAEALAGRQLRLERAQYEIVASLVVPRAGVPESFSLHARALQIRRVVAGSDKAFAPESQVRYRVRTRPVNENAAVLFVPALSREDTTTLSREELGSGVRTAAVFVVPPSGGPRIVITEARLADGRIVIEDAVDALSYGSPVWMEGGFAGMMQHSRSAVAAGRLRKDLH